MLKHFTGNEDIAKNKQTLTKKTSKSTSCRARQINGSWIFVRINGDSFSSISPHVVPGARSPARYIDCSIDPAGERASGSPRFESKVSSRSTLNNIMDGRQLRPYDEV